ncbi:hypothetical protein EJB05_13127, partial [Eragrostis curvula]
MEIASAVGKQAREVLHHLSEFRPSSITVPVVDDFLSSSPNLRALPATDGFKDINRNCPAITEELETTIHLLRRNNAIFKETMLDVVTITHRKIRSTQFPIPSPDTKIRSLNCRNT